MSIHQLSIGKRSTIIAAAGIAASIIIGLFSMAQLSNLNGVEVMLAEDALPSLQIVNSLNDNLNNLRAVELSYALADSGQQIGKEAAAAASYRGKVGLDIAAYAKRIDSDEERRVFDALVSQLLTYENEHALTLAEAKRQLGVANPGFVRHLREVSGKAFEALGDRVDALITYNNNEVNKSHGQAQATYASALKLILALIGAALLVSLSLTSVIVRGLKRELGGEPQQVSGIASRIAGGDLMVPIDIATHDASSVMHGMKTMRDSLVTIVSEVRAGVDSISTASSQIAAGNKDLSNRTEQQASSLEETASSMEQLTATVRQNADNAQQANQLAVSASSVAVKGGDVVAQVVARMGAINQSSKKIVDIIGVIDGISFQTNILALNAAVEAARAGEQGRGFAVVATEVRNLAQRSAQAAKEIKGLIGDSVEQVAAGSKLVDEAGMSMADIVQSIRRVTDIMGDISSASAEQTAGIDQINVAITQMDQVTQQNAALVEQAAAAAEAMQEQAGRLAQVVSVFELGGAPAPRAADVTKRIVPKLRLSTPARQLVATGGDRDTF